MSSGGMSEMARSGDRKARRMSPVSLGRTTQGRRNAAGDINLIGSARFGGKKPLGPDFAAGIRLPINEGDMNSGRGVVPSQYDERAFPRRSESKSPKKPQSVRKRR